jgi:DNA-binding protein YbaB
MIFGNMGEMLKMAREMQGKLKVIKEELSKEIFEETHQGITVKVNGELEIKELKVAPGSAEAAVKETINRALKKAREEAARKMKSLTGGLGLPPGLF